MPIETASRLTVHIFITCIFEAEIYHLVCCGHDLVLAHIASEGIP